MFSFKNQVATALIAMGMVSAESMYNPLKSTVAIYNDKNYDKQVTFNREKGISVVQFYKAGGKTQSLTYNMAGIYRGEIKS